MDTRHKTNTGLYLGPGVEQAVLKLHCRSWSCHCASPLPSSWRRHTIYYHSLRDAGLPDGVVNVVFGVGGRAGAALVKHPDVRLISFTGGTATAEKIRQDAAGICKDFSLEVK